MKITQKIKVAVDAVVFGYVENQLQLLLIKQKFGAEKNKWALPGGFVKDDEALETAVLRELKEETGLTVFYMEQLYSFGAIERDPRGRVISISYLILVNPLLHQLSASTDALEVKWFNWSEVPKLAFDHNKIAQFGLERLRNKIKYQPIGFELLNPEFPFSAIENLYQTVLNQPIDRRNFRKKLLSFDLLEETEKVYKPISGRPAKMYRFKKDKYQELTQKGFHFEIKFA